MAGEGLRRRTFLGAAAAAGVGAVAGTTAGCDAGPAASARAAVGGTRSGAGVFASGTMRWVESMMAGRQGDGDDHHISAAAGRFVTRVNTNLLLAFACGPAREHYPPAQDNLGTLA